MPAPDPETDPLSLAERLAVERTLLAAERSLLAWVRTSLSLIAFGYTAYKLLQAMLGQHPEQFVSSATPRNVGLFLILLGVGPLTLAMAAYRRTWRRLHGMTPGAVPRLLLDPSFLAAGVVVLLGLALVLVIVVGVRLL